MKVFISSTSRDLTEERSAAIRVIDRMGEAVAMEKFFASDHRSREECLRRLRECDAVVLILGFQYGSIDEDTDISITELEYRTAKEIGLPVFAFLKKVDGKWESSETDSIRKTKHCLFKATVDNENTRIEFEAAPKLESEIPLALRQYEHDHGLLGARTQQTFSATVIHSLDANSLSRTSLAAALDPAGQPSCPAEEEVARHEF